MGGATFDQKLKASGIDARKNAEIGIPVGSLWFPPKDDPHYGALAHPRENDELDEELIADMIARFEAGKDPIEYPTLVWNVGPGKDGKLRLLVVNGCRREKHGIEVQKRLRAAGKLGKNDVIRIKIEQWTPPKGASDSEVFAALICERLKQNNDPFKKPDSPRVLADTIRALRVLGKNDLEIKVYMPKGIGLREIEALANYDSLHPEARAQFDNGTAAVGLLPVVMEKPREVQAVATAEVVATGATTTRGVTRKANEKKKTDAGKPRMKMNAQRIAAVSDFVALFHNGECEKKEENTEYEIDTRFYFVTMALRAANGEEEAIENLRSELFGDDEARADFDRAVGKVKGTGRPRGRPRKNATLAPEPVAETAADDSDEPEEEEEEEEEDDGEPNPFAGILDRPDTDDDDTKETDD